MEHQMERDENVDPTRFAHPVSQQQCHRRFRNPAAPAGYPQPTQQQQHQQQHQQHYSSTSPASQYMVQHPAYQTYAYRPTPDHKYQPPPQQHQPPPQQHQPHQPHQYGAYQQQQYCSVPPVPAAPPVVSHPPSLISGHYSQQQRQAGDCAPPPIPDYGYNNAYHHNNNYYQAPAPLQQHQPRQETPEEKQERLKRRSREENRALKDHFAAKGISMEHTRRIGTGRYSKVFTAQMYDGTDIAIKMVNANKVTEEYRTKFLPREIECWKKLRHPNLVQILGHYEYLGHVFLTMEYAPRGDMLAYVQSNGPVPEGPAGDVMRQILRGMGYMHSIGLTHRDLKLENLLIFPDCVKIGDFGFAREVGNDLSRTYCGSKAYSAPEILIGQPYDPYKADVWSIGVIAFVIVTDHMPYKETVSNTKIVESQRTRRYHFPTKLSPECMYAINELMTFDWHARPDVRAAAQLPWIRAYNTRQSSRRATEGSQRHGHPHHHYQH